MKLGSLSVKNQTNNERDVGKNWKVSQYIQIQYECFEREKKFNGIHVPRLIRKQLKHSS